MRLLLRPGVEQGAAARLSRKRSASSSTPLLSPCVTLWHSGSQTLSLARTVLRRARYGVEKRTPPGPRTAHTGQDDGEDGALHNALVSRSRRGCVWPHGDSGRAGGAQSSSSCGSRSDRDRHLAASDRGRFGHPGAHRRRSESAIAQCSVRARAGRRAHRPAARPAPSSPLACRLPACCSTCQRTGGPAWRTWGIGGRPSRSSAWSWAWTGCACTPAAEVRAGSPPAHWWKAKQAGHYSQCCAMQVFPERVDGAFLGVRKHLFVAEPGPAPRQARTERAQVGSYHLTVSLLVARAVPDHGPAGVRRRRDDARPHELQPVQARGPQGAGIAALRCAAGRGGLDRPRCGGVAVRRTGRRGRATVAASSPAHAGGHERGGGGQPAGGDWPAQRLPRAVRGAPPRVPALPALQVRAARYPRQGVWRPSACKRTRRARTHAQDCGG